MTKKRKDKPPVVDIGPCVITDEQQEIITFMMGLGSLWSVVRNHVSHNWKDPFFVNALICELENIDEFGVILDSLTSLVENIVLLIERKREAEELATLSYEEFLETPYWKRISLWAKSDARFNGRECGVCGDAIAHTHHRTYKRLGKELLCDLMPLCADCHAKFHDKEPE